MLCDERTVHISLSFPCRIWKHQNWTMPLSATMTAKELPTSTLHGPQQTRRCLATHLVCPHPSSAAPPPDTTNDPRQPSVPLMPTRALHPAFHHGLLRHPQAAVADSGDESDGYGEAGLSWEAVMAAVRGTDAAEAPLDGDNGADDASPSQDLGAEPAGAPCALPVSLRSYAPAATVLRHCASACYSLRYDVSFIQMICCPVQYRAVPWVDALIMNGALLCTCGRRS